MITKSPTDKYIFRQNKYFTNSARIAFSYILKIINFKEEDTLLIPAYIGYTEREGSGVLDPIEENNISYDFYPILEDMKIDLQRIEELIKKKSIKAILLIHYFGFLHCDIVKLKEICQINNILLIEDCAHTIYSKFKNIALGDYGDFSFYSTHKVLPVESGGFFKINNKSYIDSNITIKDNDKIQPYVLEALLDYNNEESSKKICENYKFMVGRLNKIDGLTVLVPNLPNGIIPMNLAVFITAMKREDFYFKMIEKDIILIALYYRLIDKITKNDFPKSHIISNSIINFPINQDITKNEMIEIVKYTKEIINAK